MAEFNSLEWHKENLRHVLKYENNLIDEITDNFKATFNRLNDVKKVLEFRKFQVEQAESENLNDFPNSFKQDEFDLFGSLSAKMSYTKEEIFKLI